MSQAGQAGSTPPGGGPVNDITGDTGTTVSGHVKLYGHTGSANAGSSVGFNGASTTELDLVVTDANLNTLIGQSAGNATVATITGGANTGVGYQVLHSLTTGTFNEGFGYNCLNQLLDGIDNTAVGHAALAQSFSDTDNTAIGYTSLQNMFGGSFNTFVGSKSGGNIGSGTKNNNTAVGYQALNALTNSSSNNIALGYQAGISINHGTSSSNIAIGNAGAADTSNTIWIGTQGSGDGQQNQCFIAGVNGVTVSNAQQVTINSSTGQLGVGASSGNLVLIQSQTASSVTDLVFTSGITGFDNYVLSFYGVTVSDDAQNVLFQCSTDGGSSYDASNYDQIGVIISSGSQNIYDLNSIVLLYGMSNQANFPGSGTLNMYNINSSSLFKNFTHISSHQGSGSGDSYVSTSATYSVISVVNAFKISIGSGTFSGKFKLYGVQN